MKTKIKDDMRAAMSSGDNVKKSILRVLVGEIERKTSNVTDDEVYKIIRKLIESNIESFNYSKDQVLLEENKVLSEYLPKVWDLDTIEAYFLSSENPYFEQIRDAKAEGQAMGIAMKLLKSINAPVNSSDVKIIIQKIRGS